MQNAVAIVLLAALLGSMAWIDVRCLADLARTGDRELRLFTRDGWRMIIVFAFPIGPMLYLLYGRGR